MARTNDTIILGELNDKKFDIQIILPQVIHIITKVFLKVRANINLLNKPKN